MIAVVLPQVEVLDLAGPLQVLHEANRCGAGYRVLVCGIGPRVRPELARHLLNDPSLTVEGVARQCGFDGARQLRRIWREAYGESPGKGRGRGRSMARAMAVL